MHSLFPKGRLSRMLAAGLLVFLLPAVVFAIPPEEPVAPAPLVLDSRDPAAAYRDVSALLARRGLERDQIAQVWSRLDRERYHRLTEGALSQRELELLALPYCHVEHMGRYLDYGERYPELTVEQVATEVNIGLDRPFYQGVQMVEDPDSRTVLVNKYHQLAPDYEPELVQMDTAYTYGTAYLQREAWEQFKAMADQARTEGVRLWNVSSYRSYGTQKLVYDRYVSQDGQSLADTYSARPGSSEHQTGLALDINTASIRAHFEDTPTYAWLVEHCGEYGFILRYPEGKERITGYRFEPWHYRYVGREIAKLCMEEGLTYEEYVARLPVQGTNGVPPLYAQGRELELGSGALMLEGRAYLSAGRLAQTLGWRVGTTFGGEEVVLYAGEHWYTLTPGETGRRDGQAVELSAPAVLLEGELYLALDDLNSLLELDLGLERTYVVDAAPAM